MYELIEDDVNLIKFYSFLKKNGIDKIAVDIECESNLHRYGMKVNLIQFYDGKKAYIVDMLKIKEKNILKKILSSHDFVKVMFEASGDQLVIQNDLGIKVEPVIDLRIGLEMTGRKYGLSEVIREFDDDIVSDCQKSDWGKRPLSEKQLIYAARDVEFLFKISKMLFTELTEKDLILTFLRKNFNVMSKDRELNPFIGYKKMLLSGKVSRKKEQFLRTLWITREKYARDFGVVPDKLIPKHLIEYIVKKYDSFNSDCIAELAKKRAEKIDITIFCNLFNEIWSLGHEADSLFL
ncbi:MAG: hypothetical protein JW870_06190 [Candidatus Delongbacteria bacterium]|nr:hypothetical protein [Candidatus Delongbacteria bacterium]